jgi:hypothetical protein
MRSSGLAPPQYLAALCSSWRANREALVIGQAAREQLGVAATWR